MDMGSDSIDQSLGVVKRHRGSVNRLTGNFAVGNIRLASISTVPSSANIWVRRRGTVAVVIWLLGQGSGSGQNDAEVLTAEPWHRCGPIGQLALCEDRIVGAAIENHGDLFLADVDAAPDVEKMAE